MKLIYYDPISVGSLGGINALAKASKMSVKETRKWLSSQRAYSLHAPARRRMTKYRSYRVPFYGYQIQADLNDMQYVASKNKGYKYILSVIDMFSRYAWLIPLKNKTGKEISKAFTKHIFNEITPFYIQTDQGTEFYNKTFQALLKKKEIKLFSVFSPQKAAMVERLNRSLKAKMYRLMTYKNTSKWIDTVKDVVDSYNKSPHSSLPDKMTPSQARKSKYSWVIWSHRNKKEKINKAKFEVGDYVRISMGTFEKSYLTNWSEKIHKSKSIDRRDTPIMYIIEDYKGDEIKGKFYTQELQKVIPPEIYPIEKIYRKVGRRYLVKFQGYPEQYWAQNIESSL